MLARSPRAISTAVLAFIFILFLLQSRAKSTSPAPEVELNEPAPPPAAPIKVEPAQPAKPFHYADVPDDAPSSTSAEEYVPVPTTRPVISRKSPYAYVFYATSDEYACSIMIAIMRLYTFRTKAHIIVLLTEGVSPEYRTALEKQEVVISVQEPMKNPRYSRHDGRDGNMLKLAGFSAHHIIKDLRRVIILEADQYIYRSLDSLFEMPDCDIAAPRMYWEDPMKFSTTFMLVTLTDRLATEVRNGLQYMEPTWTDRDLLNDLFAETVVNLPGQYAVLNDHWVNWDLPPSFRPEGKIHSGLIAEYSKAKKVDLWRVINLNLGGGTTLTELAKEDEPEPESEPEPQEDSGTVPESKLKKRDEPKEGEKKDDLDKADLGKVLTPEEVAKEKEGQDPEKSPEQKSEHQGSSSYLYHCPEI
jgi:hypothetical protein